MSLIQATLSKLGIGKPNQSATPNHYRAEVLDFAAVAASGGVSTKSVRIPQGYYFSLDAINFSAKLAEANGTVQASGALLPRAVDPTSDTVVHMGDLTVEIEVPALEWQSDPIWGTNIGGDGSDLGYMPFRPGIAGGDAITVKVTNNAAKSVTAQLVLMGHRMKV